MSKFVTVAIIQARPVYYNLNASVEKAVALIERAASQGAQLITLGETWLPGYLAWLHSCPGAALWNHEPTKQVFGRLYENSVIVPGKETAIFSELAQRLKITLVIGVNEKVVSGVGNGTIYNSLLTFGADGALVNHHRKLMPTYAERLVWGQGDAAGLQAVDTTIGRVGGLICWEHWMPLARQALHNSGEQIHISVFPALSDMHLVASRHYAFEGRCFVLTAGNIMLMADLPAELQAPDGIQPESLRLNGGSAIIAPDGRYVAGPIFDEETILTAELDLAETVKERMTMDVSGHYARHELFTFEVTRKRFE
jgi:predicted amidohydrolase